MSTSLRPDPSSLHPYERINSNINILKDLTYSKGISKKELNSQIDIIVKQCESILIPGFLQPNQLSKVKALVEKGKLLLKSELSPTKYFENLSEFIEKAKEIVQSEKDSDLERENIEGETKQVIDGLSPAQAKRYNSVINNPELTAEQRDILKEGYCHNLEELKRRFKNKTIEDGQSDGLSVFQEGLSQNLEKRLYLSRGDKPESLVRMVRYGNVGGVPQTFIDVELTEENIVRQVAGDDKAVFPEFSRLWQTQFARGGLLIAVIIDNCEKKNAVRGSQSPTEKGVLLKHKTPIDVKNILWIVGEDLSETEQVEEADRKARSSRMESLIVQKNQEKELQRANTLPRPNLKIDTTRPRNESVQTTPTTASTSTASPKTANPTIVSPRKSEPEKGSLRKNSNNQTSNT